MKLLKKIYWDINERYYSHQKSIHELKSLSIEITGSCNFHCKHCYMNSKKSSANDLTTNQWKKFFHQLYDNFGNKIIIGITGGEPLMRPDVFEILEYLKKLDFHVSLATNGMFLHEENIHKLKNHISGVSISLDGCDDGHNHLRQSSAFTKILNNIRLCKTNHMPYIIIKTTVYKKNIHELRKLHETLEDIGVDEWHIFAMEPLGRAKLHSNEMLSFAEYDILCTIVDSFKNDKKNTIKIRFEEEGNNFMYTKTRDYSKYKLCNAGIEKCAILHNGDIVSCVQVDRKQYDIQGNILTDDFMEIWNTKFIKNREKKYISCNNHYYS